MAMQPDNNNNNNNKKTFVYRRGVIRYRGAHGNAKTVLFLVFIDKLQNFIEGEDAVFYTV